MGESTKTKHEWKCCKQTCYFVGLLKYKKIKIMCASYIYMRSTKIFENLKLIFKAIKFIFFLIFWIIKGSLIYWLSLFCNNLYTIVSSYISFHLTCFMNKKKSWYYSSFKIFLKKFQIWKQTVLHERTKRWDHPPSGVSHSLGPPYKGTKPKPFLLLHQLSRQSAGKLSAGKLLQHPYPID